VGENPFPSWFEGKILDTESGCQTLLVGVSGGPDSMVLLHLAKKWMTNCGRRIVAVHVNHGQRELESDQDEDFVASQCELTGVELRKYRLILPLESGEEALRRERYACFVQAATIEETLFLALGHNRDDLIETSLFHQFRGSGMEGLSFRSKALSHGMTLFRPLWRAARSEILAFAEEQGIPFVLDQSNSENKYARNAIRNLILPEIECRINPAVRDAIWRMSVAVGEAQDFIRDHAREVLHGSMVNGNQDLFKASSLRNYAPAVLAEAIRQIIANVGSTSGMDKILRIRNVIYAGSYDEVALGNGMWLIIEKKFVWIYRGFKGQESVSHKDLATAAMGIFPDLRLSNVVSTELTAVENCSFSAKLLMLDGHLGCFKAICDGVNTVQIRNRLPGDLVGRTTTLKKRMIEQSIPRYLRNFIVVFASGSQVLHVEHLDLA